MEGGGTETPRARWVPRKRGEAGEAAAADDELATNRSECGIAFLVRVRVGLRGEVMKGSARAQTVDTVLAEVLETVLTPLSRV